MKISKLRHQGILLVILVVIGVSASSVVYAQDPTPPPVASSAAASTGTLVAAALESAGYRAQSMVLSQLATMLNELGVLLYLGCAIAAIITVALGGKYSMGLWFVIGPALLSFIVKTKDYGTGVEWQFGANNRGTSQIEQLLSDNTDDTRVSWLFHNYNLLVSSIVQNLIVVITQQNIQNEMLFTVRQQMYRDVFAANIGSPELSNLVHYGQSVCAQEMSAARQIALGERDPNYKNSVEYRRAINQYNQSWEIENKAISETSPMARYLRKLSERISSDAFRRPGGGAEIKSPFAAYSDAVNQAFPKEEDRQALQKGTFNTANRPLSCQQIWVLMGLGVYGEALDYITDSQNKHAKNLTGELLVKLHNDLATKLTKEEDIVIPTDPYEGSGQAADNVKPDPSIIPTVMAGYMMRKSMADAPFDSFMEQVAKNAGVEVSANSFSTSGKRQMSDEERAQFSGFSLNFMVSEQKKQELFVYVMSIPYLQGIILYTLALTFPFFALMVILPGKASAFYNWMALWAWAKSWDVGYALVMVLDNLLWEMLPHSSIYDQIKDPKHSPITMMEAAFQGDPSYSMSSYYSIVTLLVVSVPIIMAKLILGAKAGGISSLMSLFKGIGSSAGTLGAASAKNIQGQRAATIKDAWMGKQAQIFTECGMGQRSMKELPVYLAPIMQKALDKLQGAQANNAEVGQSFKNVRNTAVGGAILTEALSHHPALQTPGRIMQGLKMAQLGTAVASDKGYQDLVRTAIAMQGQLSQAMVEFGAYEAMQSNAIQQFEINRAASNLRGEHTNFMEFPTETVYNAHFIAEQNKANITEKISRAATEAGALAITRGQ